MSTQPFTINIPQATLEDLRERLARTRWPDEVEGAGWDYGTNVGYLKELVDYWQHTFDWRAQEAKLNRYAQFRAAIDGVGIHFIHERGKGPDQDWAKGLAALTTVVVRRGHARAAIHANVVAFLVAHLRPSVSRR